MTETVDTVLGPLTVIEDDRIPPDTAYIGALDTGIRTVTLNSDGWKSRPANLLENVRFVLALARDAPAYHPNTHTCCTCICTGDLALIEHYKQAHPESARRLGWAE